MYNSVEHSYDPLQLVVHFLALLIWLLEYYAKECRIVLILFLPPTFFFHARKQKRSMMKNRKEKNLKVNKG